MWFGKNKFAKFAMALAMAVSAVSLTWAEESVDIRDTLYPLYFKNVTEDPKGMRAEQQLEWNYLMKFKMFGAEGIEFGNREIKIPDSVGWFGTATGDFKLGQNGDSKVGGPIMIGGDVIFAQGPDTILTGPMRVNGKVRVLQANNFKDKENYMVGVHCVGGGYAPEYAKFVGAGLLRDMDSCPDSIPEVKTDLKAPSFFYDAKMIEAADGGMRPALNVNGAECASGLKDGNNFCIHYIDVPYDEYRDNPYDIYIKSISISNGGKIVFRMQPKGRLTRVFFQDGLDLNPSSKIQIMYMDEDAKFDKGVWSGNGSIVENKKYSGELLFFTQNDIIFKTFNAGTDTLQGTFISERTINVAQHMILAGQLLANKITVDTDFDGTGFRYVPYNSPEVDIEFNKAGEELYLLAEGHDVDTVKILLDKKAETKISLEYCFAFGGSEAGVNYAVEDDIDLEKDPTFPICGKSTKPVSFVVGEKYLATPILVYIKDDKEIEETERITFRVVNLSGAKLKKNGGSSGDFPLEIEDNDKQLISIDGLEINVIEDEKFIFSRDIFPIFEMGGDPWAGDFGIYVVTPPKKDSLKTMVNWGDDKGLEEAVDYNRKIGGKYVGVPSGILDGSMGWNLVYNPPEDAFGEKYDFLKFRVLRDGLLSDDTYTLYINIIPVNDPPDAHDTTYNFLEMVDTKNGAVPAKETIRVEDKDDVAFTYSFSTTYEDKYTEAVHDRILELYELDPTTGVLSAKKGAVLNYESSDSVLVARIVVSDGNGQTDDDDNILRDVITATIRINDDNDKPVVVQGQVFVVDENAGKIPSVSREAVAVDSVVRKANNQDPKKVLADDEDLNKNPPKGWGYLTYSIKDASGNFEINSKTGVISVKTGADIDFEDDSKNSFSVTVYVVDGGGLKDSAEVIINVTDGNDIPEFVNVEDLYDTDEHVAKETVLGLIEIKDPDASDAEPSDFNVSLKDNNLACGASCAELLFSTSVIKDEGKLYVQLFVLDSSLVNYEDLPNDVFDVTLTLSDNDTSVSAVTKIQVNDINERPFASNFLDSIVEKSPNGTKVGSLVAGDPDTKNKSFSTLTYTIVESGIPFEMSGKDILVKDSTALNYEDVTDHQYVFHVTVSDGKLDSTVSVTVNLIDKNEKPDIITKCDESDPECNSCDATIKDCDKPTTPPDSTCKENCGYKDPASDKIFVNVAENSKTGMVLFEYLIVDEDAGDIEKDIVSFENTNGSGADSLFKIEKVKDGDTYKLVVTVKDGSKLDYEKVKATHELDLVVSDPTILTLRDTVKRTINVIDVNEAPSAEDFKDSIPENSPKGTKVGTLVASDPDTKNTVFGTLTYTIVESGVPFEMKGKDILVKDSTALDYETVPDHKFVFHVKVSDIEYDTTVTVTISLIDKNEKPEIITKCDESDPECNSCDATIKDCDKPTTPPDSTCTEDCGYKDPKSDKIIVNVAENSKTGMVLFEYVIKDQDAGDIEKDSVYFVNVQNKKTGADSLFKVEKVKVGDTYKLVVSVKDGSKLDYEKVEPVHELVLTVSDPKKSDLKDTVIRTINVIDVNEAPVAEDFSESIYENRPKGAKVGSLVASDPDTKNTVFGTLTYTIVESGVPFEMKGKDILVKDSAALNYETVPDHKFVFHVKVSDIEYDTTVTVTITLKDLNEGPKIVTECDPSDPKCKDPGTCDAVFNDCSKPTTPPDSSCTENCGYKNPVNDKVVVNVRENSKTGLVVLEYIIVDEDEGKNGIDADSVYFTNTNKSGADSLFKIEKVKDGDVYKLVVTVKDSSKLDYESTEHLHELTLVVVAKNDPTLVDTVIRTINIVDVNEPPFIKDGNFKIKENLPKGTTVGQVVFGDDKDLKGVSNPAFVNNVVTVIGGDSDKFSVSQGGMISTKTVLDYENDKHDYILVVEVTDRNDPTLSAVDTIRIELIDVEEQSNVEITKVVTKDSTYKNPDTVYTNQSNITAHWRGGYTLPDQKTTWTVNNDTSTTLVPGRNVIRIEYKDPTANTSVVDSVVIYYSNTLPTVTISANGDAANAHNIYTIVETPDVSDTTIYVNHESNDVVIKIHDPAKEMLGDKKSADTVIVISMELGTAKVDSKTYTNLDKVVKETVALDLDAAADAKRNVKADGKTDVSYTEKVAGIQVTISYTEDKHGDVVKVPVVQDNGKVENIEVIKVSYVTKDQKGNEITVSYYADAYTGVALMSDSQGNLMTSGAASKQEGASSKTSTVGIYNVSYLPTMESKDTLLVSYTVDRKGNLIKNASGDIGYHVSYTYTDACNNSMTSSVFIVLDKVKPEVVILSPANRDIIYSNFTEVIWTVDGVNQDTLTTQGLQPGGNTIVRFFRDKAGNEASDTVFVIMKDGKNVVLSVENPVTEVSKERVDKYYSKNPPSEGQTYAVTVQNPKTGKEVETIKGGSFGTKKGSGKEPYPGLDEDEGHLGPTLVMEVKLPVISGKDGLATLDDILSKDGLYVLKEGIDAASGDIKGVDPLTGEVPDDGKILIADYVREHCVDEVQNSYKPGDDLSKLNLYDTKVNIKLWIYTTIGGFVDYYTFSQDMNNPDYTDETGMSKLFFELKPDINGNVRAEDGRLIATGAYLYKVEASVRAKARCDIPSLTSSNGRKKNDVVKNDDDLLKSFGYKRPTEK
ncbi:MULTISPECIES: cadherin repeat domain-containing protein [unclassified Fibrobacter]|uniref:cadherin repeat domain-containing protein n=1 Tax=unclassified Fibrobacter TaxID=2634177 RepID=UPI00091081F7|nr:MULTISPECIES: cadherin domain-containing protein [unclassified Fibrobacter]OWV06685.1 hypothetical protein B7993_04995 [Fibrobacter sp. UWH3]SHK90174.1 Cadherin domain-containing protein [Fibrobacter sp. UWH6]